MRKSFLPTPKDMHGNPIVAGNFYKCGTDVLAIRKVGGDYIVVKNLDAKISTIYFNCDCTGLSLMSDEDAMMFIMKCG